MNEENEKLKEVIDNLIIYVDKLAENQKAILDKLNIVAPFKNFPKSEEIESVKKTVKESQNKISTLKKI